MDAKLKKEYLILINEIYENITKTDIIERLDYINEIMTFEYYEEETDIDFGLPITNSIPLAYIYKNKLITQPQKLFSINLKSNNYENEFYISHFKSLALTIFEYSLSDIFDKIQIFMSENYLRIPFPNSPDGEGFFFQNYLNIYIGNIHILSLEGTMDPFECDPTETFNNEKVFKSIENLKISNEKLTNKEIEKRIWFKYLCDDSKKLVIAGENLISKFTTELENKYQDNYDLSSFLLPFVKAIECEVPNLVERYLSKLIDLSNEIIRRTESIDNHKTLKKYAILINLSEYIIENQRSVDRINSISNLYYIIHYFGFIENLHLVEGAKSIFSKNIIDHLKKESRIIDELKLLGEERNSFVHSKLITQLSEFKLHYERLTLVLEFLAMLKQLSKQKN